MMEWIPVSQPPAQADPAIIFDSCSYLVTDGERVEMCDFQRGGLPVSPWAAWGEYGGIRPDEIKFWMPLPKPPTDQGEK